MKIYAVLAVSIFADYPYHADIVSYHKSLESANKEADKITEEYEYAKANDWYDKEGNLLGTFKSILNASKTLGICRRTIKNSLNNKRVQRNRTPYKWSYILMH